MFCCIILFCSFVVARKASDFTGFGGMWIEPALISNAVTRGVQQISRNGRRISLPG